MLSNDSGVKRVILIVSGKGGVGKSTITVQLALAMQAKGKKVGILDIDLCGPSIPYLLEVSSSSVLQCEGGWLPVTSGSGILVMSIGFLLDQPDDAVIWRGPKKNAMIRQFVDDVVWGELDILLVDTPPGTSDEHLAVIEALGSGKTEAIVVTTPQGMSVDDARREISFCRRASLRILGVVENMSGYVCPNCGLCSNIFCSGGGKALADLAQLTFLGSVPINPKLSQTFHSIIYDSSDLISEQIIEQILHE